MAELPLQLNSDTKSSALQQEVIQCLVSYSYSKQFYVIVFQNDKKELICVVSDSFNPMILPEIFRCYPTIQSIQLISDHELISQVDELHSNAHVFSDQMIQDITDTYDLKSFYNDELVQDVLSNDNDAPIIRFINTLLSQAVSELASDIHLEIYETELVIRFRIDGILREVIRPKKELAPLIVSRIKVMSNLDIAEKRVPQDGRMMIKLGGRSVDIRVSTLPTAHGERIVLRILDQENANLVLEDLGMDTFILESVCKNLANPHGILLVTGPTGSGKTTTLYAALKFLDSQILNILTVEDPIEYDLPGIGQTQVNKKAEMTFAKGLRAILRQDPDVVMIGEIRDHETAEIATQASLTGHMVLSTLHTNSAVAAITRLIDMGIRPFLLASSLSAVLAQRLVRRLCHECREEIPASQEYIHFLQENGCIASNTMYTSKGCETCSNSGYKGRVGIYELMVLTDELKSVLHDNFSEVLLKEKLSEMNSNFSLRKSGCAKIVEGLTSVEEVLRVTMDT